MTPKYYEDRNTEKMRLEALQRYSPDGSVALQMLMNLSSTILDFPVAGLSFIGEKDVCLITSAGTRLSEYDRSGWMCTHLLEGEDLLIVPDLKQDRRFKDLPAVRETGWRFYAGAAVQTLDRRRLGAIFVADSSPCHHFSAREAGILRSLAQLAMNQLELARISQHCYSGTVSSDGAARDAMASVLSLAQATERWERMQESVMTAAGAN